MVTVAPRTLSMKVALKTSSEGSFFLNTDNLLIELSKTRLGGGATHSLDVDNNGIVCFLYLCMYA